MQSFAHDFSLLVMNLIIKIIVVLFHKPGNLSTTFYRNIIFLRGRGRAPVFRAGILVLGKSPFSCAKHEQYFKLYVLDAIFGVAAGVCCYEGFTRRGDFCWRWDYHGEPGCFSVGKPQGMRAYKSGKTRAAFQNDAFTGKIC
ncbi:MAG: hypothetical protein LBM00_09995 [Deltaproteobacteria bacterium]|nr:hypothetical protein [Deltaproteobacteria bacterium]